MEVKIGVTGHRILTELDRINRGIDEAIDAIQSRYENAGLVVLSSLAEGADRIVAEAVLRRTGTKLIAVLPFDRNSYASDFGPEGSPSHIHFDSLVSRADEIIELPAAYTRNEGYEQGGLYVLENCDALVAVWDGEPAQGRGGTSEIVEDARKLGKPIAIVRAGNRKPGTEKPTSLGEQQGKTILINFDV